MVDVDDDAVLVVRVELTIAFSQTSEGNRSTAQAVRTRAREQPGIACQRSQHTRDSSSDWITGFQQAQLRVVLGEVTPVTVELCEHPSRVIGWVLQTR
ncbi:hypothetical protein D3C87_1703900 [compost metagenome]